MVLNPPSFRGPAEPRSNQGGSCPLHELGGSPSPPALLHVGKLRHGAAQQPGDGGSCAAASWLPALPFVWGDGWGP